MISQTLPSSTECLFSSRDQTYNVLNDIYNSKNSIDLAQRFPYRPFKSVNITQKLKDHQIARLFMVIIYHY
jgi:hypothetical protein